MKLIEPVPALHVRVNCGSFRLHGMFGGESDLVLTAMIVCSDGAKRLYDRIACASDVYIIATRRLETLPICGEVGTIAEYYFRGTRVVEHSDLPFGMLKLYREVSDHLQCVAKLTGWTP